MPKTFVWIAMLACAVGTAFSQEMTAERHKAELDKLMATMNQVIQRGPYQPTAESFDQYVVPDWYADAKLGIFIHYGLFTVAGQACWYGNGMYNPNSPMGKFHLEHYGSPDKFGYKDFAPLLTASAFDADAWVSLFKEAGARFVVPVSCFHDGYAMWDSKLTDWNAVKTGPHRDYDGLLAAAARKQGLKFGVAWHAFYRPKFFYNPKGRPAGYANDFHPPNSGTPWSIYGPETPTQEFLDDCLGRLVELVDGYQPDLVWFDFDSKIGRSVLAQFTAFYFNRAAEWKKGVAINDKYGPPNAKFPPHAIVLDFERGKTAGLQPDLWQTDTSVSWKDWSYLLEDKFKTLDDLVHELVDIVSKNGVLLLDVGPRADGTIPPEPQALLRGIGAWLKVNGEAIYGTRPCWGLGFGEGSNNSGGGGFSDKPVQYDAHDFRFTQKGNAIYAIAMAWPDAEDHFLIHAFKDPAKFASGDIASVKLLGDSEPLDWKLTGDGLWIRRPAHRPCDIAYAFKIELSGGCAEKLSAKRIDKK